MEVDFSGLKALVVGDVMLDIFTTGVTTRESPEAPVPIVTMREEVRMLGGAGNVATNVHALGAQVTLVGGVGKDEYSSQLEAVVPKGVQTHLVTRSVPTIIKHRVVNQHGHIVRIDQEVIQPLNKNECDAVMQYIENVLEDTDVIIISDYAKGFITEKLVQEIKSLAHAKEIPIVVDTKPEHIGFFSNCSLITPNTSEAKQMTAQQTPSTQAKTLYEMIQAPVLITCGAEGIYYYASTKEEGLIGACAKNVRDVSGAGDTVTAAAALSLACGMPVKQIARIANAGGGCVVEKYGTALCTLDELKMFLDE